MPRIAKPTIRPARAYFSSGPCAKRPGWSPAVLNGALIGRSHRSVTGQKRLTRLIDEMRDVLDPPDGYQLAIVPGSDTGAVEMAMWNLLGPVGVDVFAWDVFGRIWLSDALAELRLDDVRTFEADPGHLPDFSAYDPGRDCVFTWNGTTTGVCIPDADWIAPQRSGLVICDATSAIFAEDIDLTKIDCLTFSWQKVLGGEAAHGMMLLSPRAIARLESYRPPWPLAKIMRLSRNDEIVEGLFTGRTINTPSLLCVEDCLDALAWVRSIGGKSGAETLCARNAAVIYDWADARDWLRPLAVDAKSRSRTAVCLAFSDADVAASGASAIEVHCRSMTALLEAEGVAFDIDPYRGMPPGFRIWTGATVAYDDLVALTTWLDWAHAMVKSHTMSPGNAD